MYAWDLSYAYSKSHLVIHSTLWSVLTDCEKLKTNWIVAQYCDAGFHFKNVKEQFKKGVGIN